MKQTNRWAAPSAAGVSLADACGRGEAPKASQVKYLRPRLLTAHERALWFALCALALSSPAEWEHAPPPPGDEFLTNRLGRTWGEPIYNGYLIIDGQYIDAPYVVEQRGYVIFANGVRVENGVDVRTVLPMPEPPLVTEDPGLPADLTRDSTLGQATMHPTYNRKLRYWDYLGLRGEERIQAEIEYLLSLPCVATVERDPEQLEPRGQDLFLRDHKGNRMNMKIMTAPRAPRVLPPDESLLPSIVSTQSALQDSLGRGHLVVATGGSIGMEGFYVAPNEKWRGIFGTLASNMPPAEKVERLQALGLLARHQDLRFAQRFFPLSNFRASPQLAKRLAGDESWKAEGPEMVRKLTNGWQRIEPAFRRAPPPEPPKPAVPTPEAPKPPVVSTQAPPTVSAPTSAPPAATPAHKSPPSPPDPPSLPLMTILGALAVVAAGTGALLRVRKRK